MYLKEIKLNGFKSFADTTCLSLEPGVTAVVGPNGCGKSNIADALRWVLGEQKSKSLRADSMQDVIFQGTDNRKPVNLCEVSLIFSDCERELGADFYEVEISRRVTREKGGEYFINGKSCRLKDIQRLFMDTGVGRVSYSFMLQGQIDQIISENPSERRFIFEEAAGISRYKSQRREALNKLALTDANLARVSDVIDEVSRQIGSLKRQAAKAMRYNRFNRRLKHLELASSNFKNSKLRAAIEVADEAKKKLQVETDEVVGNVTNFDKELNALKESRSEISDQLQDNQQTVYNLRSEKEQSEREAEMAEIRSNDLNKRIEDIHSEIKSIEDQKNSLLKKVTGDTQDKQQHEDIVANADKVFQDKNTLLLNIECQLEDAESKVQEDRQHLLLAESTVTRLRSNCTTLEVDLKSFQVRHAGLIEEVQKLNKEKTHAENELAELNEYSEIKAKEIEKFEKSLKEHQEELDKTLTEFREIQNQIQQDDRSQAQVIAQINILNDLQKKLEGFSEGAKAILQGKLDNFLSDDERQLFIKKIDVAPDYTRALEALLGPALDAIELSDQILVYAITEYMELNKLGRACLQIEVPPLKSNSQLTAFPDWIKPVSEFITSNDYTTNNNLTTLLSDCYICSNLKEFLDFWKSNPDINFKYVVTPYGELVDRRGLIYGGESAAQPDSFLRRESEINKFKLEQSVLSKSLDELHKKLRSNQSKLDLTEQQVEETRQRLTEFHKESSTIKAQQESAKNQLRSINLKLSDVNKNLISLEENKSESEKRLNTARNELQVTENKIQESRNAIDVSENKVKEFRRELENNRESLTTVRLELAEKRQRLEMLSRNLTEIDSRIKEMDLSTQRRYQEIDTFTEQISDQKKKLTEEKNNALEISKTLSVTMELLEKNKIKLTDIESTIKNKDDSVVSIRSRQIELQKELSSYEVKLTKLNSEYDFLKSDIERKYEIDINEVDWKLELWSAGDPISQRIKVDLDDESVDLDVNEEQVEDPADDELEALDTTDWKQIEEELGELRSRIQSIGAVNLIAIEEYKELKERYEFLKTQSDDLWNSKNQLVNAIDDINKTSLTLFKDTFEQIKKNFNYTFETLFGGGVANLELVDNEDVLESGIEIVARPPGTKLKSLTLLSGGQKTMTAVALLFAIYMVKPSPFCVLDELDAPLDDANVGRFTEMLKRFLKFSQFLIITHNKRTIATANTIYGITMQEKGVSKLISMRFDKETQKTKEMETVKMAN